MQLSFASSRHRLSHDFNKLLNFGRSPLVDDARKMLQKLFPKKNTCEFLIFRSVPYQVFEDFVGRNIAGSGKWFSKIRSGPDIIILVIELEIAVSKSAASFDS